MSDLAQKRSILEPFLALKCIINVSKDSLRPNEHSGTKKYCKKFLSYIDHFDNCASGAKSLMSYYILYLFGREPSQQRLLEIPFPQ